MRLTFLVGIVCGRRITLHGKAIVGRSSYGSLIMENKPEQNATGAGTRSCPQHLDFGLGRRRSLRDGVGAKVAETREGVAEELEVASRLWRRVDHGMRWVGCQQESGKLLHGILRAPSL